jgi:hypothetical protein
MAQLLLEKLELENIKANMLEEQIRSKLRVISIQALRESGLLERIMMQPNAISVPDAGIDEVSVRIGSAETEALLSRAAGLV